MRIGLAQIQCYPGEVARNAGNMARMIRSAADAGCDLVVLPEMSDTGYHMPTIVKTASNWEGGVFAEVAGIASERKVNVVVGLSERVDSDIYNSLAVIGADGRLIAKYRKIHLITAEPVCEQNYIRPGDRIALCTIGEFAVGLMTCYDIRFPELARKLSLAGAEMLIVPAAFPKARIEHWNVLASSRAIENQVYFAAVNRVGDDCGLAFGGSSRIVDPFGTILASASDGETLLVGEATRARLEEVRGGLQVFRDRREDLYR